MTPSPCRAGTRSASAPRESFGSSLFAFRTAAIRLSYHDRSAAARAGALEALLEPFRSDRAGSPPVELTVSRDGAGFVMTLDAPSPQTWRCRPGTALVPFLEWLGHQLILERLRDVIPIHAGAVGTSNPTLLLGTSGAGKSTLVFELVKAGWRYWSDDLALIAPDLTCLPYPKPIKFEGGRPHALKYPRGAVLHFRVGRRSYRYVRPWRLAGFRWGTPASVHRIIVLNRDPAGAPRLTPLTPAQAVEALLSYASTSVAQLASGLEAVCQLAERTPAASLSMGRTAKDNARLIREFAG